MYANAVNRDLGPVQVTTLRARSGHACPSMRTTGRVVRYSRSRKCPRRTDPPGTAPQQCGCCTLVLHQESLTLKHRLDIDPLKLKPAIHRERLTTVGSLGERWERLEGGERDDVNRVLGLRPLGCRISPDVDGSM